MAPPPRGARLHRPRPRPLALAAVLLAGPLLLPQAAPAAQAASPQPSPAKASPRPGERVEHRVRSTAPDRRVVRLSHVRQLEPLPAELGAPARCDWIHHLRYRHREGPRRPGRADAIIVAMQGFFGGASLHDTLARNVIRRAAARGKHVEYWSLDRRANCLEDHRGIRAARRSERGYRLALDYYWGGAQVDGRGFRGFWRSEEVPFLADFGLALTMEDWYAVLRSGIPSRRVRQRKVFCGGHSLGGLLTGAFATWDFGADPGTERDAGFNQCAGYFGLDTSVTNDLGGSSNLRPGAEVLLAAERQALRSGVLPRFASAIPPVTPETFQAVATIGLAAYQEPRETGLLTGLSHTLDIDSTLRFLLSRNAAAFAAGTPSPRDFRLTNEALLGTVFDDNSQPIPALQASLGSFDGGPVVDKDFPTPNAPRSLPVTGQLFEQLAGTLVVPGANSTRLMIPERSRGPRYGWRSHRRMADPDAPEQLDGLGRPFTSPESEVTDIRDVGRSLFEGPTNAWEQYFPTRLLLDVIAFLGGARGGELAPATHDDGPLRRPYLEILAGKGGAGSVGLAPLGPGPEPRRRLVLDEYTHVDVATASRHQNDGEPEPASAALARFVLEVVGRGGRG